MPRTPWILALTAVLLLLLLGHGFGTERQWSRVNYDPKLTQGYGQMLLHLFREDTGSCYFTSFGIKNRVECEARLIRPDWIHVRIVKQRPADPTSCGEALLGNIMNGMFACYYQTTCKMPSPTKWWACTTKRQGLTLDKKTYRVGDLVTGRVDFECLEECPECEGQDKPKPVTVEGVFRTILQRGSVRVHDSSGKLVKVETPLDGNQTEVRDSSGRLLEKRIKKNGRIEVQDPNGRLLRVETKWPAP